MIDHLRWVRDYSAAKGAARLVLGSLADHANDRHVTWAGVVLIAAETRLDLKTVRAALTELVRLGEVARVPASMPLQDADDEVRRQGHTAYRLTLPPGPNLKDERRDALREEEAVRRAASRRKRQRSPNDPVDIPVDNSSVPGPSPGTDTPDGDRVPGLSPGTVPGLSPA